MKPKVKITAVFLDPKAAKAAVASLMGMDVTITTIELPESAPQYLYIYVRAEPSEISMLVTQILQGLGAIETKTDNVPTNKNADPAEAPPDLEWWELNLI